VKTLDLVRLKRIIRRLELDKKDKIDNKHENRLRFLGYVSAFDDLLKELDNADNK